MDEQDDGSNASGWPGEEEEEAVYAPTKVGVSGSVITPLRRATPCSVQ